MWRQSSGVFRTRQIAAWMCISAYLCGGSELLPELLALSASMEGSHVVHLARKAEQVEVVLGHQRAGEGLEVEAASSKRTSLSHRHGAASKLFCLLAERIPANTDHVASFAITSVCESAGRTKPGKTQERTYAFSLALLANSSLRGQIAEQKNLSDPVSMKALGYSITIPFASTVLLI